MARAVGLAPDTPVLIALSGGADSVYLLHLVAGARPRPPLLAVHIEHGLRGEEGREDAEFCARLCASLAVPFARRALELADDGGSLEARARTARYRALCEEAARAGVGAILTGHHADDALETLLQRWMRGTDVGGLAGLRKRLVLPGASPRRGVQANERLNMTGTKIQVVRPLIAMRREEVRRVLSDAGIAWREDLTNKSSRFARNRIRNELLPAIEAYGGPHAVENLRAFGAAVEALEERCASLTAPLSWSAPLHAAARRGPVEAGLGGTLPRAQLSSIPSPLRRRALWRLIVEGTGHAPSASLLELLLSDLASGRNTRHSLAGGWSLVLRSDLLHLEPPARMRVEHAPVPVAAVDPQLDLPFSHRAASERVASHRLAIERAAGQPGGSAGTGSVAGNWARRLELPGLVSLDDGRQITAEIVFLPPGTDVLRCPSNVEVDARDFVAEPPWAAPSLWVRLPQPGDRFHALGAPGKKSLSRFLADAGVPREDRGRVPLVFAGDELVWVAGIRPCEPRRVRPDTEVRLRLELHVPTVARNTKPIALR